MLRGETGKLTAPCAVRTVLGQFGTTAREETVQSLSALLSPPETPRTPGSEHTRQGTFVSVLPTVASFFSSLSANYSVHKEKR